MKKLFWLLLLSTAFGQTMQVTHGGTGLNSTGTHQVLVSTATNTYTLKTVPDCTDTTGNHLNYTQSTDSFSCGTSDSHAGTVTSVGLTVNATSPSGIFTVTGSPVTGSGTLNFNLAGNSGGIPYFSSGTVLSSSSLLTAHGVLTGGGSATSPGSTSAGAADTIFMGNDAGAGSDPAFKAGPSGGTNGCAGTTDTPTYNTGTHAWGCHQITPGTGGGIKVNTSAIAGTNANFSDTTPAAASNHINVTWQKDATTPDTNISAEVAAGTDTVLGVLKTITCSNQFIRSFTSGTGAPSCDTVGTNDLAANAATSAKMAVVNTRRVCMMVIGADNAAAVLANADLGPQLDQCFIPFAATVVEIEVMADAGTPNVIVQRSHLGTPTALLSGALATAGSGAVACSNTGGTTGLDGTTSCTNTLQNTSVAVGDWIGLTSGTAGGTAKRMSIAVVLTVN